MKVVDENRIRLVAHKFVKKHRKRFPDLFLITSDLVAALTRLARRAEQETWWKTRQLEAGPAGVKVEEVLRPCPFCGGRPVGIYKRLRSPDFLERQGHPKAYIYFIPCNDCSSQGSRAESPAEAVLLWNKRPREGQG